MFPAGRRLYRDDSRGPPAAGADVRYRSVISLCALFRDELTPHRQSRSSSLLAHCWQRRPRTPRAPAERTGSRVRTRRRSIVYASLTATPNPVHLLYGAQSGTFDLEWRGQSDSTSGSSLVLHIHRSGQAPDPPVEVADVGVLSNVPIEPWETIVVQITGDGEVLDEVVVATAADVPPLDCAIVVCGSNLEELVYPDWVNVTLHVAEVRSITVVVSRVSDRRVISRTPLAISEGVATDPSVRARPGDRLQHRVRRRGRLRALDDRAGRRFHDGANR